jgi:hypothetical protein
MVSFSPSFLFVFLFPPFLYFLSFVAVLASHWELEPIDAIGIRSLGRLELTELDMPSSSRSFRFVFVEPRPIQRVTGQLACGPGQNKMTVRRS